jgi:hypothetical protein
MIKEKVEDAVSKNIVAGLDIDKIIKKAREYYGKEKGLAKQLSTGDTIVRPVDDSDFVVWSGGDHWFEITRLKGLPYGKITQISGRPDSGKSTHALAFMKYAQDQNVAVILWDSERKFNAERFDKQMGGRGRGGRGRLGRGRGGCGRGARLGGRGRGARLGGRGGWEVAVGGAHTECQRVRSHVVLRGQVVESLSVQ